MVRNKEKKNTNLWNLYDVYKFDIACKDNFLGSKI